MLDPRYRKNIVIGATVKIEESKNFGANILIQGEVEKILTKKMISFHPHGILVLLKTQQKGHIKEMIKSLASTTIAKKTPLKPESSKIEYKETLFHPTSSKTKPEQLWKIPHSIFKSIAGFANAEGGELWIGVNDNLEPVGLDRDFPFIKNISQNRDGFAVTLTSLASHYFKEQEKYSLDLFEIDFPLIDGIHVCKISVKRSPDTPLILYDKNPESPDLRGPYFYVRQNNSTQMYSVVEFLEYWMRHFKALHDITV